MISSLQDFKTYVDQACRAADEFVNIYYETMDKRRRALTRLYLDKATLVWNGNAVSGQEELNKFFEMLPSSEFQVNVLDCQPVHGTEIFKILMCRRIHPFSSSALLVISSKFLTYCCCLGFVFKWRRVDIRYSFSLLARGKYLITSVLL
uniref:NTF2-related export protein n=1 Tax=Zosterops lateralis melanops TaxID=1220523 RepID=A0A8D2PFU5_ZOSLA